jgi:hypothetical protein
MKFATVKSLAAKLSIAAVAAGAFLFSGTAPAQAQQFAVALQHGQAAYVVDRDDHYRDRHEFYERERREQFERERRDDYLRHQAWLRQEQWERNHRFHDHDHDHDFYGYR